MNPKTKRQEMEEARNREELRVALQKIVKRELTTVEALSLMLAAVHILRQIELEKTNGGV